MSSLHSGMMQRTVIHIPFTMANAHTFEQLGNDYSSVSNLNQSTCLDLFCMFLTVGGGGSRPTAVAQFFPMRIHSDWRRVNTTSFETNGEQLGVGIWRIPLEATGGGRVQWAPCAIVGNCKSGNHL